MPDESIEDRGFRKIVPLARVQLLTDALFALSMMVIILQVDYPDPEVVVSNQQIREFLVRAAADPEMQRIIRAANHEDLALYEHVRSVTYPAQQVRWQEQLAGAMRQFQARQATSPPRSTDSWSGRAYRNLVVKPLVPWVIGRKPAAA